MFEQILRMFRIGGMISSDLIILGTIFVISFIYAFSFGRNRTISFIISFYIADFLFQNFHFLNRLIFLQGDSLIALNKLIIFIVIFLPLNIIIGRYITESGNARAHIGRTIGYSFAMLILVLIFSYSVVNLTIFYHFSPVIDNLFSDSNMIFWWDLIPIAILAIF